MTATTPSPIHATPPAARRAALHRTLLAWYGHQRRDLPWRRTRDPYAILVAEVMLQQTQVDRVLPRYHEFLARFPTLAALAAASPADVIRCWSGLGYNVRAVRLHQVARRIVTEYGGQFPRSLPALLALPGLGPYTARAVACFAFEDHVPVVDTNVRRVLGRVLRDTVGQAAGERFFLALAEAVLPPGHAYEWNQALMDLGATICTARKPLCLLCPLSQHCDALRSGAPIEQPGGNGRSSGNGQPFVGSTRYYRGRILAALRAVGSDQALDLPTLGRALKADFGPADLSWLRGLLYGLERDGLVVLTGKGGGDGEGVRLPH
ncbi:MAG: A/G-specific adenine glycosylase [Chloroflexi bacterium]|nr:A/G-specific adenine glycosylase [Chloroflexota bacterium]